MPSSPVPSRFRRLAGFAVLLASLSPLRGFDGNQAAARPFRHGTTTCFQERDTIGIKLLLTEKDRCGEDQHPYVEIDIREDLAVRKDIIIGPDNWAFRCASAREPCEQIPSGKIVFDRLVGPTADLKTEGHYQLRMRSGKIEEGSFKVDCRAACTGQ